MSDRRILFALLLALLSAFASAQDADTPAAGAADANAAADEDAFDVWEFRVSGNTLLPQTEIEKLLYPHLGAERGMQGVEAARVALETRYRDLGFPTVL